VIVPAADIPLAAKRQHHRSWANAGVLPTISAVSVAKIFTIDSPVYDLEACNNTITTEGGDRDGPVAALSRTGHGGGTLFPRRAWEGSTARSQRWRGRVSVRRGSAVSSLRARAWHSAARGSQPLTGGIHVNPVGPDPIFTPFHQRRIAATGEFVDQYNTPRPHKDYAEAPGPKRSPPLRLPNEW
jgi:hypothetical protein